MRLFWLSVIFYVLISPNTTNLAADLNWKALDRGEIIVEEVESDSGIPGVRASFLVTASREAIWSALVDYDNFPKFFKGIDRLHVLEQDDKGAHVEFWVDAILADLHYVLYRHYAEPGHRLTWHQVSGDLEQIQGSWEILDTANPEKKLLIYDSYVDVGFYPITWVIRSGAKAKAEEMGYRLRKWLEKK